LRAVHAPDALELQLGASHDRLIIRRGIDSVAEHIDLPRPPGYYRALGPRALVSDDSSAFFQAESGLYVFIELAIASVDFPRSR
jgi:hypothetical protein